jgi:hypothetical protein
MDTRDDARADSVIPSPAASGAVNQCSGRKLLGRRNPALAREGGNNNWTTLQELPCFACRRPFQSPSIDDNNPRPTMISRSTVTRGCQLVLRGQSCAQTAQRRTFAAAAAIGTPGSFEPTEIAGLKVASKDAGGPTTRLAIVAKAGTRYQPLPGLTVGLEEFAFKVGTQCRNLGAFVLVEL